MGAFSCDRWYKIIGAISVIGRAAVITVFTMRTYTVCAQNRLILYVLGAIGLTCVVLDCLHVPGLRCQLSSSIKIGRESHRLSALPSFCSTTRQTANTLLSILICVLESVAAIFTVIRSFQANRVRGKGKLRNHTLHYLLLEQGVLYFWWISRHIRVSLYDELGILIAAYLSLP
ncbi:hypothetical protein HETIRDRAFT_322849 [Heterobasidion irregulare TC 32-1]|uniref:Uncharacterized protein n=1 Tax=Heterobasidion irregulare (strain TC 32-1) TaxID=747525 RepID=W4K486_HETIT|nr:uncharacterized protein HETIRDRAFT_322849 [Heterobasidion irregulare TC 32-1]ETW79851.1 hypothetical protein HETIRDRAFT_322849 [Heterobasidion irregulare TC 32-1]